MCNSNVHVKYICIKYITQQICYNESDKYSHPHPFFLQSNFYYSYKILLLKLLYYL